MVSTRFGTARDVVLSIIVPIAWAVAEKQECNHSADTRRCQLPSELMQGTSSDLSITDEERNFTLSGFCPDSSFKFLGSCYSDHGRGLSQPIAPIYMRHSRCFCDSLCNTHQDCCIDKAQAPSITPSPWTCRQIKLAQSGHPTFVYMYQKCPHYSGDDVRNLCEKESEELQRDGEYFNYLQDVPVHGNESGVLYRNVYCAVCNADFYLTKWKTYLNCIGTENPVSVNDVSFTQNALYRPQKKLWRLRVGGSVKNCELLINDLAIWTDLQKYGTRLCKPAVSSCPPGSDETTAMKCRWYTSYIYTVPDNTVYKNYHCARCNGVASSQTTCVGRFLLLDTPPSGEAWLPLLFDFNFDGAGDNQVGQSPTCRLEDGQVWDPILKVCLNLTCGRLYKQVDGSCVPLSDNVSSSQPGISSECRKVVLNQQFFVFTENESIYVNHTGKTYKEGEYEVYETTGSSKTVLICEDELPLLLFSTGQVWISEFTLGISITCLVLHLATYGLLPKLQNRPGKIVMCLSAAVLVGHLFFLLGPYCEEVFWLCYLHALLTYYGYLCSFFWMSVMAFDIYLTFSSTTLRSSRSSDKMFIKYSVYAWAGTFVVMFCAVLTDTVAPGSSYRPKFGNGICWFNHKRGLLIFFGVPVAILLLSNLVLFLLTAFSIHKVSKQAKAVNNFSNKLRYYLYIKLATVFGLTWIFGFVAAFMKVDALWYPFIILNGLQGALIFLAFAVKRKVMHMLSVKLKLRSEKYILGKDFGVRKGFYTSLSNLTTLQTSLTSTIAPAASGSPGMLKAVRRLNTLDRGSKTKA